MITTGGNAGTEPGLRTARTRGVFAGSYFAQPMGLLSIAISSIHSSPGAWLL
jgi:hypothetical protein